MKCYEIENYRTAKGDVPFRDWIHEIADAKAQTVLFARIDRAAYGNFGDSRALSGVKGLHEMRIHFGQGGKKMTATSEAFDYSLRDQLLRDPENAAIYLAECLEDGDIELFQEALRTVAKSQKGGVRAVAKQADLNRESLYKALSRQGKPQLATVSKMLAALGLRFSIRPCSHCTASEGAPVATTTTRLTHRSPS